MKVKIIATGAIAEYNDTYALRLIEQGIACPVDQDTPVPPEPEEEYNIGRFSEYMAELYAGLGQAVRYDTNETETRTATEKEKARRNISAVSVTLDEHTLVFG